MASIRLSVPSKAALGDVIELKALIQHPMESGYRRGSSHATSSQNSSALMMERSSSKQILAPVSQRTLF